MKLILTSLICALLLFTIPLSAQIKGFVIPDSLKGKTYEELRNGFSLVIEDVKKAEIYIKSFKAKAIKEQNAEMLAESYHLYAIINKKFEYKIKYLDSSIVESKAHAFQEYPARAILYKAILYDNQFQFEKALDYYTQALDYTQKSHNQKLEHTIKYLIGLIKINSGDYEDAKKLFSACIVYFTDQNLKKNEYYIHSLYGMSEVYYRQKKLDSCSYYNHWGIRESLKYQPHLQNYFQLNEGIVQFKRNQYTHSIRTLDKVLSFLSEEQDTVNTSIAYYFMGKNHLALGQKDKGIDYLLKMDALYQLSPYILYEERQGYDELIKYYNTNNDLKKQLVFINKTIQIDSFQKKQYAIIKDQIKLKYDTPQLLSEKEKIISKLNNSNHWFQTMILVTLLLLGMVVFFWLRNYRNNQKNQLKYQAIIQQLNEPKSEPERPKNSVDKELSDDTFETIRIRLATFERNQKYRDATLNLQSLSKQLQTNSTYLSRYINKVYGKSLTGYLSDLRINDALFTLKNNPKIRNYTIKAISEIFGFNTTETFSKEFLKKTGIYPSKFIRELNKIEN
jgi:AraC-like DNA-binding protein